MSISSLHDVVTHHSELLPRPHTDVARNEYVAAVAAYHRYLGGCRVKVKVVERDALQWGTVHSCTSARCQRVI
jgi:hypothetical protein